MYFPIFRGRQFELLALRELAEKGLLSKKIIPVLEPVKASSTLVKTIDAFISSNNKLAIIRNPQVGTMTRDLKKEVNSSIRQKIYEQLENDSIISSYYVNDKLQSCVQKANEKGISIDQTIMICNRQDNIRYYEETLTSTFPLYSLIPDKGDFRRRIRHNRVLCEDHFPKKERNIDYLDIGTEFFSTDHLFYDEDGYKGFSDYSVVGEEYNETGFAPYAVAIHIVYFDDEKALRIAHFVSDTNDDISDPAGKYAEAAHKFIEWNRDVQLKTKGITELVNTFNNKTYPGLGVLKKYSIMHHLELMGEYLESRQ